jgi:hypothetical protein
MKILNCLLFIILTSITVAQTTYELQPGSKKNLFEMSISNNTSNLMQSVKIFVQNKPEWVNFAKNEMLLYKINKLEKQTIQFYFDVLGDAPIGEESKITFRITNGNGGGFTKVYNILITAPTFFEVQQNYPNPFNPNTTIQYSIPQSAFVSIKVFNVLGEIVKNLVNKDEKTGVHEVIFNADNLSSGFYFYLVEAKGVDGTKYFDAKKMVVLK